MTIPIRTAYDLPKPSHLADITEVGRGTPMGELLRRYWHPVGLASDAGETPRRVRVLGENLILFRDRQGRPGLLHERCAHRGASLYYGRTEDEGIRCCYHGWMFAVDGQCVDQPCEPNNNHCARVRQPWYPVEERYGLIFAYLGPLDRKPLLPRLELLENLGEGEFLEADDSSIGGGGPAIIPCNWLQHYENVVDPYHVPILHGSFSGTQFVAQMGLMPDVSFDYYDLGIRSMQLRRLPDGSVHRRVTEAMLPTLRVVPSPRVEEYGPCSLIGWVLPIDDTHFRIYSAGRVREVGALGQIRSRMNGKAWTDLTPQEHQMFPGDYEAQVSQGDITAHNEENLATTDRGIAMLRRFLVKQVQAVKSGQDPVGVAFVEGQEWISSESGNFLDHA
ncbi:aromatic ring-hydroxylating dioxygenase subunit alpha [Acidovorax cavernicola]|uniref:Aromatic ring-hydroxylating dioxygenase subunit alpha n=1 Tax=Acidovorax cavernicola TaxID=1675792 RepID=A0A9X8D4W5_9BURK|nr:aromatic ring-hydroxylating dioxygenase subunit alpha [Acidovorax cavernicola]RIX79640.1 aromatic ring-hydroxylating dioxygenase subunit alpha [Acidovorax cavernicola]